MTVQNIRVPVPHLGFEVAISKYKVKPTTADLVGDIESVTGMGVSVESVPATPVTSKSGYTKTAPTIKTAKPFTLGIFNNNVGYNVVRDIFNNPTTSEEFFCSVTLIYPKVVGVNDQVPDYTYHGYFSDVSPVDVDANGIQKFTSVFTPNDDPEEFVGPLAAPPVG